MNTISSYSSFMPMISPTSNISRDIITQNDTDSDSMPTKEEFASIISELGLTMPDRPEKPGVEGSGNLASDIMSNYDSDGDFLLSSSEVSELTEEEFSALDSDGDGSISMDELTDATEQVARGSMPPPPPPMQASNDSEDTTSYSPLDTNEDGVVSIEELAAAYTNSEDSSTANEEDQIVRLLLDTILSNAEDDGSDLDLSSFVNIMKMINNQNNNSQFNSYLANLSSTSSLSLLKYA